MVNVLGASRGCQDPVRIHSGEGFLQLPCSPEVSLEKWHLSDTLKHRVISRPGKWAGVGGCWNIAMALPKPSRKPRAQGRSMEISELPPSGPGPSFRWGGVGIGQPTPSTKAWENLWARGVLQQQLWRWAEGGLPGRFKCSYIWATCFQEASRRSAAWLEGMEMRQGSSWKAGLAGNMQSLQYTVKNF